MPNRRHRILRAFLALPGKAQAFVQTKLAHWRPQLSPSGNELTGVAEQAAVAGLRDASPRRRWEAAALLARRSQRSPEAISALLEALADPEPFVRWQVVEALGKQEASSVFTLLCQTLESGAPIGRAGAAEALGHLGGEAACLELRRALEDSDPSVRTAAAHAMSSCADPSAVQALLPLLADPNVETRYAVAHALGRIGDTRAAAPLAAALQEPGLLLLQRRALTAALARVPHPEVQETLLVALADSDPQVRGYAANALGHIGNEAAWTALQKVKDDNSPLLNGTVADEVRQAITLLERRGRQAQAQSTAAG